MFAHIATFIWKLDVTEEEVNEVVAYHRRLRKSVPQIRELHFGPGLAIAPSSADYVVVVLADDEVGIRAYLDHPLHVELVNDLTSRMVESRAAVQIEW